MGENDGDEPEGVCGVAASLCALCGSSSGQVSGEKQPTMDVLGFRKVFHEHSQRSAAGDGRKCLSVASKREVATHLWPFFFSSFSIYTCGAAIAAQGGITLIITIHCSALSFAAAVCDLVIQPS